MKIKMKNANLTKSIFLLLQDMPTKLEIVVFLIALPVGIVVCQPAKKGTGQTSHVLPAILSFDQSLPMNGALPVDAIPRDIMVGRANQVHSQVAANNMNFVGGKAPMNRNVPLSNSMTTQAEYPAAMEPVNNMAVPMQSNNPQHVNLPPEGMSNGPMNGMNYPPGAAPVNPPMNMYYQQWESSMSADLVLRNIQIACSTLQNFVLQTPIAREITESVSNINNMAEIFNSPKQCGFPALSTTLRVFLKTCNIYSSCSNPTGGPLPVPTQPQSPDAPYKVQQQTRSTLNPQIVVQQPQPASRPLQTTPYLVQQFQTFQTQIMRMFNWLHNNFRFSQQTNNASGQQKQAKNTTSVPFDD
jgi:hypothetical protein